MIQRAFFVFIVFLAARNSSSHCVCPDSSGVSVPSYCWFWWWSILCSEYLLSVMMRVDIISWPVIYTNELLREQMMYVLLCCQCLVNKKDQSVAVWSWSLSQRLWMEVFTFLMQEQIHLKWIVWLSSVKMCWCLWSVNSGCGVCNLVYRSQYRKGLIHS